MSNRLKRYNEGAGRGFGGSSFHKHTADDEVDAIYINTRVKRDNARIQRDRRDAGKAGVTLAVMPWDVMSNG